jgi:hypothetical protein
MQPPSPSPLSLPPTAPHKGLPQLPWAPRRSTLLPPPLSLTDEHFRQLGLEFVETRRGIIVTELNDLFVRVSAGWIGGWVAESEWVEFLTPEIAPASLLLACRHLSPTQLPPNPSP